MENIDNMENVAKEDVEFVVEEVTRTSIELTNDVLTFSEYCASRDITLVEGNEQLDYLTKINMDAYLWMINGLCLGVELVPIRLKGNKLGILPTLYFNESRTLIHCLYDLEKLDCKVLEDLKVVIKSVKADNYVEYLEDTLVEKYRYNFNTSGYRPTYNKYSKNILVIIKDNDTEDIFKIVKYGESNIDCVTLTRKFRAKKLSETDEHKYINLSDIGIKYSVRIISN